MNGQNPCVSSGTRKTLRAGIATLSSLMMSAIAIAGDPAGLYVGGSIGEAHVRNIASEFVNFDKTRGGWKAFAGARPLTFVGVEVAYVDFGSASAPSPVNQSFYHFVDDSKQGAITTFALGYLPLPVPFLDVYAKVGVARLHTQAQETAQPFSCPAFVDYCGPFTARQNLWSTDFAYGAGVQAKLGTFSVRAEYERIDARGGDPDLLSLGGLWRFS